MSSPPSPPAASQRGSSLPLARFEGDTSRSPLGLGLLASEESMAAGAAGKTTMAGLYFLVRARGVSGCGGVWVCPFGMCLARQGGCVCGGQIFNFHASAARQ